VSAVSQIPLFHISIPVTSLTAARVFYGDALGCQEGRSASDRVDFNFFGHHLVAHVDAEEAGHRTRSVVSSGVSTPIRHFGVILDRATWTDVADRLRRSNAEFIMEPQTIFQGDVREQAILLVADGSGNVIEFKSHEPERLFVSAD
jgi:extradiol dioxygenase family protein